MSTFELDEAAVAQTEEMLRQTGDNVDAHARSASDAITGLQGAGWLGAAMTTASNQQTGPFASAMAKLHNEINHMSEALGLGRVHTGQEDEAGGAALAAVNPEVGNNFTTRL